MEEKSKIKLYFFGTPEFAAAALDSLIADSRFQILGVVTQPDKPVGRKQELKPSPIKIIAKKNNLKVIQPIKLKNNKEIFDLLNNGKPDLIIVSAYGKIIPKEILDIPKFGCINIHPSLLPKYRGPSPIQSAILNCDEKTGITIMLMDEGMDSGDLLAQKEINIDPKENFESLHDKLSLQSAKFLIETIIKYLNKEIIPQKQDNAKAVFCKLLEREDGKIDFSKSVKQIDCQIRAFTPWPGAFTQVSGKRLKITDFEALNDILGQAGDVVLKDNEIYFCCKDGALKILKLQLEGKKEMPAEEFLRGNRKFFED